MLQKIKKKLPNGSTSVFNIDENNRKQGTCQEYYSNGQLKKKCTYQNDLLQGPYESYHENGALYIRSTYRNDKKEGLCEMYHRNGQLFAKIQYADGKRNGLYEEYYENGKLRTKCTYKDDITDGTDEEYYPNGQLEVKCTYKNGKREGINERYYENGQLSERCFYKNGEYDGPYERYDESGAILIKCVFRNGERLREEKTKAYLNEWGNGQEKSGKKAKIDTRGQDPEWQDLKDRLKHLTDGKYYKKSQRARTRERQVELEEIMMARRSKTLLLKAATKARLAGDKDRFDAIMALAKPFAKKHELVMHVFRDKRAENKKRLQQRGRS